MATRNQINNGLSGQTGTGTFALSSSPTLTSPSLVTPVLGTPSSGSLINCTNSWWGTVGGSNLTLQYASGLLTTGQINTLNASPVQLIAAAGANILVCPFYYCFEYLYGGSVFTAGAGQVIRLVIGASTSLLLSAMSNSVLIGTNNATTSGNINPINSLSDAACLNAGIFFTNPVATEITGGSSTVTWKIWYTTINVTL